MAIHHCERIDVQKWSFAHSRTSNGWINRNFFFPTELLSIFLADCGFYIIKQVSFQVADALQQPFPDGQFDLVWSMESGEHMPNKAEV